MGEPISIARRDLLKGSVALVIGATLSPVAAIVPAKASMRIPTPRTLNPARLDTWLAIAANGEFTAYWGKMDMGQGVDTAIAQIIAEELDVDVDIVNVVAGDSARCADQGGASASTGVQQSGAAFRQASAEARLLLFEKAVDELDVPMGRLTARAGVIHVEGMPDRAVSYAELVGGGAFDAPVQWNGEFGNRLALAGRAMPKDPVDYNVVGQSIRRKDIGGKILAKTEYLQDVFVEGLLHGRIVRPNAAGARVKRVDESSVSDIPDVQVVVEGDFVGVVAPDEWDTVRAARKLVVEWDESDVGFPTTSEELFDWIRGAEPALSEVAKETGNFDAAYEAASHTIVAEYEWPFQSHARMAGAASVADVSDAEVLVWTDSQKPFDVARGAAALLETPVDGRRQNRPHYAARSIWKPGAGSYGRSDAGDGAMDAVLLSEAVGKPVRVQWMRDEGHAWDPKGPASVVSCRAGFDERGRITAYHFHIKGFSRTDMDAREDSPAEVLAGHLIGHESTPEWRMQTPAESYDFPNKRYSWDALAPLRSRASPLRTAHFRDPYGPEVHFASESFVDEMAYATETDPVAFRLDRVQETRDADVIRAAAELAGWDAHVVPRRRRDADGNFVGQGIAYADRNGAVNAIVAEVVVNPSTGRVWVRRLFVGADHGLVVNPFTLDRTIEGNLLQAMSRTLFEEVKFDRRMVRSVDWQSYPILEAADAPLDIRIHQLNRRDLNPRGAGEATTRVVPPAIANAFFDATGVRLRRVPFTPGRVRDALQSAS